jgi:hypothetical protein
MQKEKKKAKVGLDGGKGGFVADDQPRLVGFTSETDVECLR